MPMYRHNGQHPFEMSAWLAPNKGPTQSAQEASSAEIQKARLRIMQGKLPIQDHLLKPDH